MTMARISPQPTSDYSSVVLAALGALRPPKGSAPASPKRETPLGRPKGMNVLGTLARHPELAQAYLSFNRHILFTSSLSDRQRELLILRVARLRNCAYEWAQHVVLGADAGLSDEEIVRISQGPEVLGWDAMDRSLLRAVDELIADAEIESDTWVELAQHLDEHQLMDVVFTVGCYEMLAMAFRSFGVELDADLVVYAPHGPGWDAIGGSSDEFR